MNAISNLSPRAELAARLSKMTGSQVYNEMKNNATKRITPILAEGNVRLQAAQYTSAHIRN
jgi:hypothetical protein